jgi:D-glycero-D-manno-heptose 1,7-bisphosphate phosphatase
VVLSHLTPTPAAFLDRDGTVIEELGYLADPDQIRFIPGSVPALHDLRGAGFRLVLLTNQAGVARGLLTEKDVQRVNDRLDTLLREAGVPLDRIYYCPHHPEVGPPEYRRICECRKPGPGMAAQAQRELQLDLGRSVIFGDHATDAGVARHFPGMRSVLVLTGHGADQLAKIEAGEIPRPDHIAPDLRRGVDWLLAGGKG